MSFPFATPKFYRIANLSRRTLVTILLPAVIACAVIPENGKTAENSTGGKQRVREKKLPFELATDDQCWVTGQYRNGHLELITVSIGLSNARLRWVFFLSGTQLRRFSVVRAYYDWDPQREQLRRGSTSHERVVNYTFEGGKMIRQVPPDSADLADDKWTRRRIAEVLGIAKRYLESGQRETFEQQMEAIIQ